MLLPKWNEYRHGPKCTHIKQLFNTVAKVLVPIIIQNVSNIDIKDKSITVGTPTINMTFNIVEANVSAFSINNDSPIVINKDNTVCIKLNIISFKLDFTFGMKGLSDWIEGTGNGHVYLKNFGFTINSTLKVANGKMSLDLTYVEVNLTKDTIDFYIHGTNDWINLVNMSVGAGMPFIIKEINGVMPDSLKSQLQNAINGLLAANPTQIALPLMNLLIDYGLVNSLATTSDSYVQFGINGTVFTNNKLIPIVNPPTPVNMPGMVAGAGDMQFLVSQYVIQSSINAIYTQNLMNIAVTSIPISNTTTFPIDNKFLSVFIPELIGLYPPSTAGKISINVAAPPAFVISSTGISMGIQAQSIISVQENMIATLTMNIQAQVTMSVSSDGKLNGKIQGYTFTLKVASHDSRVNPNEASLNQLFNTVMKFAIPQLNDIVMAGIPLPVFGGLSFKQSSISQNDGYLTIGSSPVASKMTIDMVMNSLGSMDFTLLWDEILGILNKAITKTLIFGF